MSLSCIFTAVSSQLWSHNNSCRVKAVKIYVVMLHYICSHFTLLYVCRVDKYAAILLREEY